VECVAELESVLESETDLQKVLNLKDVRLVDRDAVRFLARCEANGTALENCRPISTNGSGESAA